MATKRHTVNGQLQPYCRLDVMLVEDWLNLAYCAEMRAMQGVVQDGSRYNPKRETESRNALIRQCVSRLNRWEGTGPI